MTSHDRTIGNLLMLAAAAATWWLLKSEVLQAYPVKTPSMEPTIEGDRERGDLVLVDKTFDNRAKPQRFDSIVFEEAEGSKVFVKRVAGLPGEYIQLRKFDVWVGQSPTALQRVVKSAVEHRDLLVDYWSERLDEKGFETKLWLRSNTKALDSGIELDGCTTTAEALFPSSRFRNIGMSRRPKWRSAWQLHWNGDILIGYVDAFGERHASNPKCIDFGLRSRVHSEADGVVWLDLRYGDASWALRYTARGEAELWRNGARVEGVGTVDVPPLTSATASTAPEVTFLHLDGGFVLVVDGVVRFRHEVDFTDLRIEPKRDPNRNKAWNGLGIAASNARVQLHELTVIQDLHYLEQGSYAIHEAHPIPDDSIFVLGDNSRDSRDSRHQGSVALKRVIGRPFAILAPGGRRRLLRR